MADAWLEWNGDFQVSAGGGLLLADGDDLARQRILRRLLTATKGYVWQPEYGAGLPQRVGRPARAETISSIVRSQIALEAAVSPDPPPTIKVAQDANQPGLFTISISYTDAATGEPVNLSFSA